MFNIFSSFFDSNKKVLDRFWPEVHKVSALEEKYKALEVSEMKDILDNFRSEIKVLVDKIPEENKSSLVTIDRTKGLPSEEKEIQKKLLEFMPDVYAIVREVLRRGYERRHFDVQILAGVILAQGQKLTELKTGEGKTQVFHLPLSLYGLTRRGAHAVTVNDYLARRDGEYAGHIFSPLGYTVGVITPQASYRFVAQEEIEKYKGKEIAEEASKLRIINPGDTKGFNLIECTKKESYECDIVYGTNNEFGFDYLRDNMSFSLERIVQRELYFCIVDEADSILIDEARTPLIISAPAEESNDLYARFAKLVPKLTKEDDFTVDEKAHSVMLTEKGIVKMEGLLGVKNIWEDYRLAHHLENALKAMVLYKKDKEYMVKEGEVLIVDQFTGRVLAGRRYSEGLHQAIEAKEGVEVNRESRTLATITFQNFFRLYKVLNGASGTIMTEAGEFYKIYTLDSIVIPTNNPVARKDLTDRVYKNREAKFMAVTKEIAEANKTGQPILVGTTSITDSEYLSSLLDKEGIKHEVLNAKYHEKESKIIADAGKKFAVTVATNMAGRGTDIKLGGQNATKEEFEEVLNLGGLYVIGTERHEARRVDNQLRGRSGRQGENGLSRFYVSLDDDIMRIQGGGMVQRLMEMTRIPDDMPIESGLVGNTIESAQKKMEGQNFDIRKRLVDYDSVMNQQREIFYSRRRNILTLTENAQGKFMKGKDVVIVEDADIKKQSIDQIVNLIETYVLTEVDSAIQTHFFSDRADTEDKSKAINDVLDLSDDSLVVKALEEIGVKTTQVDLYESLEKIISGKQEEEIIEFFKKLFKQVISVKIGMYGKDLPEVSKAVFLQVFDELWTDHLENMQDLREGIGLRGYAQRDPLVEYKNEAFTAFENFITSINSKISRRILKMVKVERIPQQASTTIETNADEISDINEGSREILNQLTRNISNLAEKSKEEESKDKTVKKVVAVENDIFASVGRNDICPCGSGKKFKKCHGKGR